MNLNWYIQQSPILKGRVAWTYAREKTKHKIITTFILTAKRLTPKWHWTLAGLDLINQTKRNLDKHLTLLITGIYLWQGL